MTEIIVFSLIIIVITWMGLDAHNELRTQRDINSNMFVRTWAHEKFLMKIYNDCPPSVQKEIEEYLNNVKEL